MKKPIRYELWDGDVKMKEGEGFKEVNDCKNKYFPNGVIYKIYASHMNRKHTLAKRKTQLTERDIELIAEMFHRGKTQVSICAHFRVTKYTLEKQANKYGYTKNQLYGLRNKR